MSITRNSFKRPAALFAAAAILVGAAAPALLFGSSASAGQVTSRQIKLSDSAPSSNSTFASGVGSGTNVSYEVKFTAATATNIGGIVVDICGNTPLVGDTSCTYPAGFDWGGATPTVTVNAGLAGTWTAAGAAGGSGGAQTQVLQLSNSTPETPSAPIRFTVTGVTNPNATNLASGHYSFYARIITFDTAGNMTSQYTTTGAARAASFANDVDYGGVALSVQNAIQITARVMETMSFCTSAAVMTAGCTGATTPSIEIGENVNGTIVLDNTLATTPAYSQVSTNATSGYAIYMKARYACGGLSKDSGTTCEIPAVNSGGSAAAAIADGDGEFGAQVGNGTADSGGSGTNTAVARWAQTGSNFLMDTTTASDGVDDTYGSLVVDSFSESPVANRQAASVNNTYTFGAAAASTTPAGIYTQAFVLVAVGVF